MEPANKSIIIKTANSPIGVGAVSYTHLKEYPKRQITKDFRKKAEHFQTNKRGDENAF